MAFIDLRDDRITIDSEYRERDLIKEVPGTTWDRENRIWTAPLSWAACVALRGVFGPDLEVGEALNQWAWDVYQQRVQPLDSYRTALEAEELLDSEQDLYSFQRSGVRYLEIAKQALIADEMGSGKTIRLIRTVARQNPDSLPVLVIAPNSMKYTWKKEFEKWSDLRVAVVEGTAAKRRKAIDTITNGEADVLVMNWEGLRLHSKLKSYGNKSLTEAQKKSKELNAVEWGTVIADEAHRAKDPNAQQTRALWAVSERAKFRYAATGTPIANNPGELWSIMHFVAPDDFPRKTKFVDRYCLQHFNPFGGMEIVGVRPDTAEELQQIMNTRMIRRLKDVVLPHLPPKTYSTRLTPMEKKQADAYNQMADHMLAKLESGEVTVATNPLAMLTRLSQFACAYATTDDGGNVRLTDPSNKLDAMMEIIEEAEGEQIVFFAESRQLIEMAEERLRKAKVSFGSLHGNVPVEVRAENMERFQNGELRIMLVTLGAGGEGVTLTAARIAVFLQRSYSLVKNKQAEDRIHRPGQDADKVEIIDLITPGTIEEARLDVLATKEERLQEVVRDDDLRALLKYR